MQLGWAISALIILSRVFPGKGWTQEELDLFDLVEEVGQNFYDLMQIDQTASSSEVRRAYRQLSLQLHPDKNDEEDAAEKFRIMMAVSEVLRNEERRSMYDQVLKDGLPNWKQPLFYYRRMRKMGLVELFVLLLFMLSVGHYLFRWAVFFEKQITIQDYLSRKQKRESRKSAEKGKASRRVEKLEAEVRSMELEAQASIPRLNELLPVLLVKGLFWLGVELWKWLDQKWRESSKKALESGEVDSSSDMKANPGRKLHNSARRRRVGGGEREENIRKEVGVASDDNAENQNGKEVYQSSLADELEAVKPADEENYLGQSSKTGSGTDSASTNEEGNRTQITALGSKVLGKADERQSNGYSNTSNLNTKTRSDASATKLVEVENGSREQVINGQNDLTESLQKNKETGSEERASPDNQHARTKRSKTQQKQHKKSQRIHDLNVTSDTNMEDDALRNSKNSNKPDTQNSTTMSNGNVHNESESSREANCESHTPQSEVSSSGDVLAAGRDQNWTQFQQKQLEWALTQFPKFSQDRWPNIARSVPGKTQEECIQRCRQLFEDLKKKRNN